MIEALMYGLSPKAMTEKLTSVPPEKISRRAKNWFCPKNSARRPVSIAGTGTYAKSRNTKKIKAVKSIFFLSSGVRRIWIIGEKIEFIILKSENRAPKTDMKTEN